MRALPLRATRAPLSTVNYQLSIINCPPVFLFLPLEGGFFSSLLCFLLLLFFPFHNCSAGRASVPASVPPIFANARLQRAGSVPRGVPWRKTADPFNGRLAVVAPQRASSLRAPLTPLPIVNCQLSTVNCQLSTVNCQLSIVNCQLSIVNCQLSTVNCFPSFFSSLLREVSFSSLLCFLLLLFFPFRNPAARTNSLSTMLRAIGANARPQRAGSVRRCVKQWIKAVLRWPIDEQRAIGPPNIVNCQLSIVN